MSFVAYTPTSYAFSLYLTILFFLAVLGFLVGILLAEAVEARVMLVGSVVYWVVALFIWPYAGSFIWPYVGLPSENLSLLNILVLFVDVTYVARYMKIRRTRS